jgi:hypothetical protein
MPIIAAVRPGLREPNCIICHGPFTIEPWNEGVCYACQNLMNLPDEQRKAIIQSLETQEEDPTPHPADSP